MTPGLYLARVSLANGWAWHVVAFAVSHSGKATTYDPETGAVFGVRTGVHDIVAVQEAYRVACFVYAL